MTGEREMTAPMTTASAEIGQSLTTTNSIIPQVPDNCNPFYGENFAAPVYGEPPRSPGAMQTVSMPELYEMVYPGKPPLIEHFLYPGTYLFVGAPKVGKSFMMAQIAYHVSSGTPMWQHAVRKGTVLYLALEDDYRRLQERMYRMFGTETTPDLFFSVASSSLGEGLLEQLGAFLAEHPDTSLVIIDTLQKVREAESDTYSYARDYDVIAALKAFSDRTGICLLLVHHTRKQKADDSFDRISGTNGLLGAADGAFIMYKSRRSDNEATIEISGRDQPDKRIQLTRNKQTLCWDFKSERAPAESELPEPVLEAVGQFIGPDNPMWEGTATELKEKLDLDIKPNILTLKLNVNASKLYNRYFIQYCTGRSHQGRKIMLRYDEKHPTIVEPDTDKEPAEDDTSENEFQYQPIEGNLKAAVCYIGNEGRNPFDDMTEAEKENFLATSY